MCLGWHCPTHPGLRRAQAYRSVLNSRCRAPAAPLVWAVDASSCTTHTAAVLRTARIGVGSPIDASIDARGRGENSVRPSTILGNWNRTSGPRGDRDSPRAIAPPGAISAGDEDGEPQPSLQGLECHQPATLAPVERDTAAASRVEWYCLRPHGSPDKRSRITIERHSVRSARTR